MNEPDEQNSSHLNWDDGDTWVDKRIDADELRSEKTQEYELPPAHLVRRSVEVTLHLDPEILTWFKAQGDEYEQRINAALRIYVEAHKKYTP